MLKNFLANSIFSLKLITRLHVAFGLGPFLPSCHAASHNNQIKGDTILHLKVIQKHHCTLANGQNTNNAQTTTHEHCTSTMIKQQ